MDIKKSLGGFVGQVKRAAEVAAPIINPVGTAVAKKLADQFKPAAVQPAPVTAPADPMAGLGAEQKAKLQTALAGGSGPAAQTVAQAALAQASTLPQAEATKLLNVAAMNPGGPEGVAMAKVFSSPTWLASTPAQKGQILDVASTASPKGLDALATLAQQGKLNSPDAKGGTLLSNLQALATQPQAPEISGSKPPDLSRQAVLDDVLKETANPQLVQQGPADTCGVTSTQYEMARRNPGEYARIIAGLTGRDAKVELAAGPALKLHVDSLDKQPADTRSGTDRLFQSAGMEFANGSDGYNPVDDKSTNASTGRSRAGLTENEARDLTRAMFNKPNTNVFDVQGQGPAVVAKLQASDRTKPVTLNFTQPNGRGHAVSFDHVENGRIFFRNPTVAGTGPSNLANARVEANGLESMSIADFQRQGRSVTGEL